MELQISTTSMYHKTPILHRGRKVWGIGWGEASPQPIPQQFFAGTRIYLHGLASAYFPTYPPTNHNAQRMPQQLPLFFSTQRIPQPSK